MDAQRKRIAIACQGGGSHTAFTAGALQRILQDDHHIVALSGTSGGAICATLAWYGLLLEDRRRAIDLLEAFWRDNSASSLTDKFLNDFLMGALRLRNWVAMPEISPYALPTWAQEQFRSLLERHIDFPGIKKLLGPKSPHLYVGAVEVLSGHFRVFRDAEVGVEAILASSTLPALFRAVPIDGGLYWDGLFSQNPPVRDLPDSKPDEIWVIQINPWARATEPQSVEAIADRRNELSGNLSLAQELFFIEKINQWVEEGLLVGDQYKVITIRHLQLSQDLDLASKMDRDPGFIGALMTQGRATADAFLAQLEDESVSAPVKRSRQAS